MKEITDYIDVYNAVPDETDKRKAKIAEIADGLGVPPWEVAETLNAAGCGVNLQWFNQMKRKANAVAAAVPVDVAYLKKIIDQQDKQLRRDADVYKELQDRARDLTRQLTEKDGEITKLEAAIRSKDRELEVLAGRLEEVGTDEDDHEEAFKRLFRNHEEAKKINAALRKELEEQECRIEELEKYADAADERCKDLQREVDWITENANKAQGTHFEMIEATEDVTELDLAALINNLCMELTGVEAYLCGRILEVLWCWRKDNGTRSLRLLDGLVGELIKMQLAGREEPV